MYIFYGVFIYLFVYFLILCILVNNMQNYISIYIYILRKIISSTGNWEELIFKLEGCLLYLNIG